MTVWKSENMPGSLHYGTNERTLDLTVVADSAWSIIYDRPLGYFGGAHGYDNRISDMFAIFYAYGPAFKENFPAPAFENVDLYSLIAEILNIKPTKTDGKLKRVKPMLKE